MEEKLDLSLFTQNNKKIRIGKLSEDVINKLGISCSPCDIVIWEDRVKYTEKHKKDFDSEEEFYHHIEHIPSIISNPDYIGLHPKDGSIQYIKKINKIMLVGIRIKPGKELNYRSAYPITETKLQNYIESGRLVKVK